MICSLRTATEFRELRSTGRRISNGPLTMIVSPADRARDSHVAYAIGRRVGNAVERNRLRRRLRAILADVDRHGDLPISNYLVMCERSALHFDHVELVSCVEQALHSLRVVA